MIAVIGLGVVGTQVLKSIPDAIGIDIDQNRLKQLKDYNVKPVLENPADIYLINLYSTEDVLDYIKNINYENHPLIVIESTIKPGTENLLKEIILKNSSNLVICPHRLNPNDPDHQVFNLKRVIAGATKNCLKKGLAFYKNYTKEDNLIVTDLKTATLSKVVENAYRFTEIALAEELKLLCNIYDYNFDELRKCTNSKWNIDIKEARDGIKGRCLPKDIEILNGIFKKNEFFQLAIKFDKIYKNKRFK